MKKFVKSILLAMLFLCCFSFVACDEKSSDFRGNSDKTSIGNQSVKYVLKTFSSTDEYGNAGTYTQINTEYDIGENIELQATIKNGYSFAGWFINDICISKNPQCTYTMKAENVEIEARYTYYTINTYSNMSEYENAGTYTSYQNEKISMGEQVTLEASANKGYNFEGWFIDNLCVSKSAAYTFIMKEQNIEIKAVFSAYTLTTYSDTNRENTIGTYTIINEEKVSAGETVSLVAQPAQGCNFEGWYIWTDYFNSICVCEAMEYTFQMGKENLKIEARFSAYTLNTNAFMKTDRVNWDQIKPGINIDFFYVYGFRDYDPSMGDYTKYDNAYIAAGEVITLTATENLGYRFLGWKRGFDLISTDKTYTFVMGKEDIAYEAVYIIGCTLTTKAFLKTDQNKLDQIKPGINIDFFYVYDFRDYDSSMGDYTKYNNAYITVGDEITLTATAKAGYRFLGWKRGFDLISTSPTYSFIMGDSDVTYEAVYIIDQ